MTGYVDVPITVDPEDITRAAVDYLQAAIPGLELAPGHLESWLIDALARMCSEASQTAAQVPSAIFKEFGARFLGITQGEGTTATATSTWTLLDTSGYTIPAGTLVAYRTSGDDGILLAVSTDITIAPGSATATGVLLEATVIGADANGIPSTTELELVDALSYVTGVTLTSITTGGIDAEDSFAYQDRMRTELQLLTPRPILPRDFAVLASRVLGVERALAISGYDPDADTDDNERYVGVALVGADGEPVDGAVATAVETYLDGLREINFVVKAFEPTYTTVAVDYTIRVLTGYAGVDVLAAVDSTIAAYLSPSAWAGGLSSPPTWDTGQDAVRRLQLGAVMAATGGVDYVATLEVNGAEADLSMTGHAPLPRPGTITGAVV